MTAKRRLWPSVDKTIASGIEGGKQNPRDLSDVARKSYPNDGPRPDNSDWTDERDRAKRGESSFLGSAGPPKQEDAPPPKKTKRRAGFNVDDMNKEFALVLMGTKAVVVHE